MIFNKVKEYIKYGIWCHKGCGRRRLKFKGDYYCPYCDRDKLEIRIHNEGY